MARAPLPEKSFPRGGKKPKKSQPTVDFGLFKSKSKKVVKKKQNKGRSRKSADTTTSTTRQNTLAVHDLNPNDIRPGMVLYGCVDAITDFDVQFSIPGNCRAIIPAVNISPQLKSLIRDDSETELPLLSELFEIGQFYPLIILERFGEHSRKFKASLEPTEINAKLLPSRFIQNGIALTGSIASVEEHGYIIDLGIPKVTAFLRKDDTTRPHIKGQLVNVFVKSLSSDHHRIQLTTKSPESFELDGKTPVHCLLPGLKTKLMVSQILKGGIEVYIKGLGSEIKGFIHNNHLPKIFDKCTNYPEGSEIDGTLLYVMPILNFPFFMATNHQQPTWKLSFGNLIENVKVVNVSDAGLTAKMNKNEVLEKMFIPVNRVDESKKIIDEKSKLKDYYQKGQILEKVRVERPSRLGRFYYAAIDRDSLKEAFYSKENLNVGQKISCTFLVIGKNYCTVEISKHLKGFVPSIHVTELPGVDYSMKFKIGQTIKGRVLSLGEDGKNARITLKPSLLKGKMLTAETEVKVGEKYPGTICKIFKNKILVEFFGGRVGEILKENMTLAHHGSSISDSFKIGQIVNCYIVNSDQRKLALSLICNKDVAELVNIGQKYHTVITDIANDGVYVNVRLGNNETHSGFVPNGFISNYEGIWMQKKKHWNKGDQLPAAVCVYCDSLRNPPILLAINPIVTASIKKKLVLEPGLLLPCLYIPGLKIVTPAVPHDPDYVFQIASQTYSDYKIIYAKIKEIISNRVVASAKLPDVWDGHYLSSFSNLNHHIVQLKAIQTELKKHNSPLADIEIGQKISAKMDGTDLKLKNGALAKCWSNVDSKVSGRVAWIDLSQEIVWIFPHPKTGPVEVKLEKREFVHAKIVHVCLDVVVGIVAGSHEIVFIPTRRHENDNITHEHAYSVGESVKLYVERIDGKLYGIDRRIAKRKDGPSLKNGPVVKKRKIEVDEPLVTFEKKGSASWVDPVKLELMSDDDDEPNAADAETESDIEIKSELDSQGDHTEQVESPASSDEDEINEITKPEPFSSLDVGFDWSVAENPALLQGALKKHDSSSDDDDEEDSNENGEKKKRKRLTGAEKKEKAKETEERLRNREMQLVDPTRPPQTADDFDRLVMSSPDNSAIWQQYMAHHLENTEIEKARAVAQRALKSISFRQEEEKLNIWFALMNLEQLYGDADSQKKVLDEALRSNEPYPVHLHKLNMLTENGAGLEAEKLSNILLKKYGEKEQVWSDVGGALMKIGKIDSARNVLQRAITTLPNSKHVALITKFAKLENTYGSSERAQTLYENVLSAFPKRVDVWSAYVDLMVKSNRIDLARQILERATAQTLPLKKMKTLFKKFIAFEEVHGSAENVEAVRQAAAEFIDKVTDVE